MHAAWVVLLQCTALFQELNYPVQLRLRKDAQGNCALSVAEHKGRSAVVEKLMRTRTHGRPRTARAAHGSTWRALRLRACCKKLRREGGTRCPRQAGPVRKARRLPQIKHVLAIQPLLELWCCRHGRIKPILVVLCECHNQDPIGSEMIVCSCPGG